MVEIDTSDIDTAFRQFCDIMGVPCKKVYLWRSVLEFSVFLGFGVFTDPKGPPAYPDDMRHKIDALLGPHSKTIIKAYKVRRSTPIGYVRTPIIKTAHAIALAYYIARELYREKKSW